MARFVFRLQTVLDQRRREEDAAKRALGERIAVSTRLRNRIAAMQDTVRRGKADLRGALTGRVQASDVGRFATHAQLSAIRGQRLVLELAAAEGQVNEAREVLRQTIARRRAIELLEERDRAVWRKRQRKLEQTEMDELTAQRFARTRANEEAVA
ncbi:MAG: flagellar export protein FliJ [Planctomycetota bacterium]